jgi:hypothetical protein
MEETKLVEENIKQRISWLEKRMGLTNNERELITFQMKDLAKQLVLSGVINWVAVKNNTPKENERVLAHNGRLIIETSWQEYTDQDEEWFKRRFTYWTKTIKPPCL